MIAFYFCIGLFVFFVCVCYMIVCPLLFFLCVVCLFVFVGWFLRACCSVV